MTTIYPKLPHPRPSSAATLAASQLSPTRATPVRAARVPISAPDTPTHDARSADAVQTLGDLIGSIVPSLRPLLNGLGLYDASNPAALIDTASPAVQSAIQQVIQSLEAPNVSGVAGTVGGVAGGVTSGITGTASGIIGGVPVVGGVASGLTSSLPGTISGVVGTAGGLTSAIPGLGSIGAVRTNASSAQNAPRSSAEPDSNVDVFTAPRAPPNTPERRAPRSPLQSPSPLHAFAISETPTKPNNSGMEYPLGASPLREAKPLASIPDTDEEPGTLADDDEEC